MFVLKSSSFSRARLYFGLLAMLVVSLACTPQHLNGKNTLLQKSSQNQLSPLHEPHFGIKSLAYKPEEESNVIFLAASDNQPIRVATRRDIPQNMGIDLQDMTMNGANLPTEIQPALSVEEVKNRRKALLKEGRRFLKDVFKLIQSELRNDFLARKHALQSDKELLPGKANKPERKELQAEIKRLENQFHDRNKILKNAFKSDWRDLESRIKTVLPKPEKGFKTQALGNLLVNDLSSLTTALNQTVQQMAADITAFKAEAFRAALGGLQEKNQPLVNNMIWLNEQENNPGRNIYVDNAVYKMVTGSGQVGTLIPPNSEVVDQSIARKTLNSKIFIDESIRYFNSLDLPSFNSQYTIQDLLKNLDINFSKNPEAKAFIDNECRDCPPSIETRIYPNASTLFKGTVWGLPLTSFIEIHTSQELAASQKFIMSIRLKSYNKAGEKLLQWMISQIVESPAYKSNPSYGNYIINELRGMSERYILDGADVILSLESPEMCQTPDYIPNPDPNHPTPPPTHQPIGPEMKVGSDIWLTDLIKFKDLSNEGEKSAIMAINEDNLLVQGAYKFRIKIKYPYYYPQIREFCNNVTSNNECILAEQDVTFLEYSTPQKTVPGIISPSSLPADRRLVDPSLEIKHIDNPPSFERSYIGYHIQRTGSNPFDVDVKLSDIDTAICNLVWDLRCVDYKKSLLEFSHQSLDTGVYSVIAKFSNPQHIRELNVTKERRFAALHLQYATFAHLTDKPYILDAWGLPKTDASQQPQYLLTGINHMGFYFNTDQSLPNPPLQSVPNTLPAHNQAVQVGSEIVYDALSNMKQSPSTFLSGGYFSQGIQNTLVELTKPHAEGMNQAFDAFRLVNFDSANPKPYLQIGFVANLHNRYTANNNLLHNGSSQPVYLEVVDAATGNVRARFPRFVKLGSQTYISVYWDGQPQNLTPEEEENLPDDSALDADGAPNYLTGEYSIRLSLPPDEEQALVAQPHLDFNFNSRRSYRPYTDVTWPTISPVSSDVQVKIQKSNRPAQLRFVSGFETDVSPQAEALTTAHVNYLIANELTGFQTAQNQPQDPITKDPAFKRFFGWFTEKPQPPAVYKNNLPTHLVDIPKSAEMSKELAGFLKYSKNLDDVFKVGKVIFRVAGPVMTALDYIFPNPVNPITILPIQSGLTYGNIQDPFCQEKPITIRILAELQEYGPKPVQAEYTVYRATGSNYEEVYSDDLPPIQPRSGLQEFVIPWDMEDESGNTLPPGLYLVVLEPKGNVEVSPQTTGATFGIKLIEPNAEAQQRTAQINGGSRGDFSTLAFHFETSSLKAKETLLGMSAALTFNKLVPYTNGLLGELDLAGNASPTGAPSYQGLGLKIPTQPPFLYGSNFTRELTDGYVSWLIPYLNDPEYISLYDLAGLVYHLYRGQEVVTKALDNTKCRNPYVHTFLKVIDDTNGVKKIIQNDVNRVTPKINMQNTSIADQNDIIKLIADSPAENRLTFSNALHSLHFPSATSSTTRIVAGPGKPTPDVKFKNNNSLIFSREHKNRAPNKGNFNFDNTWLSDLVVQVPKDVRSDSDFIQNPQAPLNIVIQTHPNSTMTKLQIQDAFNKMTTNKMSKGQTECEQKFKNLTMSIIDPNGYFYENEEIICKKRP